MGKLGRLEGEPVAKPVRRAYLGGYLVYDVGRRRAKSLLVYKKVQVLAIFETWIRSC